MLSEMKINDYIDLLASDAPAPGGGSASALCGAQGAGLCAMVAALNLVSCARGAWLNILINLGGIADAEKAQEIRAKGEGILAECESMGGDIYAAILKQTEE